jgi:predicted outer membrane protein
MKYALSMSATAAVIALAAACGTAAAQTNDNSNATDPATQSGQTTRQATTTQPASHGVKGYLSRMWHADRASPEQAEIDAGNMAAPDRNSHPWQRLHPSGQTTDDSMPQQNEPAQQ